MTLFFVLFVLLFFSILQPILHHLRHQIKENYYGLGRTSCNHHKHLIYPLQFPIFSNTCYRGFDQTNLAGKKVFLALEL